MTGVIWLVQMVNYPLYVHVGEKNFSKYQIEHINRITPLVGIPMVIELFSSFFLLTSLPTNLTNQNFSYLILINLVLNILIWLFTVSFSVPTHQNLKDGWDEKLYKKLLESNWARTIAWTLKSVTLALICLELFKNFQEFLAT